MSGPPTEVFYRSAVDAALAKHLADIEHARQVKAEVTKLARQADRAHIIEAIDAALNAHDGMLTIAWVRQHITRDVAPYMIGAVMSGYVKSHDLVWTGDYHPNGGPSGNAAKPARVWMRIKETK